MKIFNHIGGDNYLEVEFDENYTPWDELRSGCLPFCVCFLIFWGFMIFILPLILNWMDS